MAAAPPAGDAPTDMARNCFGTFARGEEPYDDNMCFRRVDDAYYRATGVTPSWYPVVQNIAAMMIVADHIDLEKLAQYGFGRYDKDSFGAAMLRQRETSTTFLVFDGEKGKCSKVVNVGARDEHTAFLALKLSVRDIMRLVRPEGIRTERPRIHNMVASGETGFPLNLFEFYRFNTLHVTYNPDTFPGVFYYYVRSEAAKVVIIVFATGKFVITGAKSRRRIKDAYEHIMPRLVRWRIAMPAVEWHRRRVTDPATMREYCRNQVRCIVDIYNSDERHQLDAADEGTLATIVGAHDDNGDDDDDATNVPPVEQ
jgi:transcription initiation factor TFIID TATA-box-binding protein